ncbi:MAG: MgtC/SapB family protein [Anaerolineae bacterium]|nr:MgtC/SapB family protein [Anaerolineae bacterium]
MSVQAQLEALIPLAVTLVLSGLIGLDRQWRQSPAGMRTHMMVGIGSALVMVMAQSLYDDNSAARLAANVITGIGFLGAGVIVRRDDRVHELTTAASLWFVAMIGLVAGARLYVLATGATVMGVLVLSVLRWLTRSARADRRAARRISAAGRDDQG